MSPQLDFPVYPRKLTSIGWISDRVFECDIGDGDDAFHTWSIVYVDKPYEGKSEQSI
jgi:hypothetical protein